MLSANIIGLMAVCVPNKAISYRDKLPWHYPEDLDFFRKITYNKTMIMGRKTFDSMPKNLFNHRNAIVFSKNLCSLGLPQEKYKIFSSIQEFIKFLSTNAIQEDLFMIGGSEIANLF